jgi:hypothetical protein
MTDHLSTSDLAGTATTDDEAERATDDVERATDERDDTATGEATPLLPDAESESYRSRWQDIQTRFVDEPRGAVEEADALVAELMKRLAETFAEERGTLERHWCEGEDVDTENLRVALQRYRSFFERLLHT